jgi:hypothetical protein
MPASPQPDALEGGLMPIRPEHVFLYPIDWPLLSHHVRFVRAGRACNCPSV